MRLIGRVNGVEVSFDFYPPNQFRGEVPKNLTGVYIIQLQAVDDGGNTTEYSNIIIKIDFSSFKIEILPANYEGIVNATKFNVGALASNAPTYKASEVASCFNPVVIASTYTYKELI